jgi:hypothetical protein
MPKSNENPSTIRSLWFLTIQTRTSPMKFSLLLLFVLAIPSVAEAKKYTAVKDGKEVVVHTNPAPVAVHRVLPPYGVGKHVYAGRRP